MTELSLRELKKQRTRARILEIALEVFHRDGFVAARLSDVARQAEISEQTLFNYFTTKEMLFEVAVSEWLAEHPLLMDATIPVAELSVEEAFTPPLNKWLAFLDKHRWMLSIAAAHTDLLVPYRRKKISIIEANQTIRLRRVKELQQQGRVRKDISAEQICTLYLAIRDHVIGFWLSDPDKPVSALRNAYRTNMSIFMAGIVTTPQ